MKIYKTQIEVEKDIKNGVLAIDDNVTFKCDISIEASINALDINALDINALDIDARNIDAWDIKALNIKAWDIDARNINVRDIDAENINARDIDARNILYHAFCCVYDSIKCTSFKAKREVHQEPICLDGKLTIKKKLDLSGKEVEVKIDGITYKAVVK